MIKRLFLYFILVICFSCEEQGILVNCPDCYENEPLTTDLEIKLDVGLFNTTRINVYEGNLEDSVLYSSFIGSGSKTTTRVTINKKYTITAEYYISENTYITVDSATPKVKYTKDQCDSPCYYVYDKVINLRLKYTK